MYSAKILDYFHHPRNVGEIARPSATVEVTNPVCGDVLRLSAVVCGETIVEAKFKVAGCVPAVACSSWVAESLQGKAFNSLRPILPADIEAALNGLPPASKHASILAADALNQLVDELKKLEVRNWKLETR
jgi:NifU-like protein involved in Fe-S cluster formation